MVLKRFNSRFFFLMCVYVPHGSSKCYHGIRTETNKNCLTCVTFSLMLLDVNNFHSLCIKATIFQVFPTKSAQMLLKTSPITFQWGSTKKIAFWGVKCVFLAGVHLVKCAFQGLTITFLQPADVENNPDNTVKVPQFREKTADFATLIKGE